MAEKKRIQIRMDEEEFVLLRQIVSNAYEDSDSPTPLLTKLHKQMCDFKMEPTSEYGNDVAG